MNIDDCFREGLLKKIRPQLETAKKEIENAKKYLDKARKNEDMGIHDIAVIAAYTSMFHAARTILYRDGIKERSHICIVLYLKAKYPELQEQARILDTYRRFRHTALYGIEDIIDKVEAETSIQLADEFIKIIEKKI